MRLIVGISGATGVIYGIKILEELKNKGVESHLVISKWGQKTIGVETDYTLGQVENLASVIHDEENLGAAISSGSFKCDGMIIAPCSMKTLAGIASGYADGLLIRAADVTIKEKRKLVLMVRESPLNSIHLENMLKLSRLGVLIMPPVPALYTKPASLGEVIEQTVGRVLDQFGVEIDSLKRWGDKELGTWLE